MGVKLRSVHHVSDSQLQQKRLRREAGAEVSLRQRDWQPPGTTAYPSSRAIQ